MKSITVRIVSQYGNDVYHPVCNEAKFFAALAGTKTLTPYAISLIKNHGYTVAVAQPAVVAL